MNSGIKVLTARGLKRGSYSLSQPPTEAKSARARPTRIIRGSIINHRA